MTKVKEEWAVYRTIHESQLVQIEYDPEEDDPSDMAQELAYKQGYWGEDDIEINTEFLGELKPDEEPSTEPRIILTLKTEPLPENSY